MQHTEHYSLNKPDGTDYAKIAALNENADKIDAALKALADALGGIDLSILSQAIQNVDGKVTQHLADDDVHLKTGERTRITNAVQKTGDTMIGDLSIKKSIPVLNLQTPNNTSSYEVRLNATDNVDYGLDFYKNSKIFMQVIGQKDVRFFGLDDAWFSIQDLKSSVSNGKTLVANAITQKNVPTSPTDEFATMAANILAINPGKKFVIGTTPVVQDLRNFTEKNGTTVPWWYITINNLEFKPSYILAYDSTSTEHIIYDFRLPANQRVLNVYNSATSFWPFRFQSPIYVNETGFLLPHTTIRSEIQYLAIE